MAKRLLRKLTCHDGKWTIHWQELDENGGLTSLSMTSRELAATALTNQLEGMRVVPQVICGINPTAPTSPIGAVGVSGISVSYGKDSNCRILKCNCYATSTGSDELWKFTTPEICESNIDGIVMPQYLINMLDGLTTSAFRFIDGERAFNETPLFKEAKDGDEDGEAADTKAGA